MAICIAGVLLQPSIDVWISYICGIGASMGIGLVLTMVPRHWQQVHDTLPWGFGLLWMIQGIILLQGSVVDNYILGALAGLVALIFILWGRLLYPPYHNKKGLRKTEMILLLVNGLVLHLSLIHI